MPSVLYIQYNNPAAYPPIENSSRILAERGFKVYMLGLASADTVDLKFADSPGITLELIPPAGRQFSRRACYLRFIVRSLSLILRLRPDWVYVSDYMAAPVGWIAKKLLGRRVVYHEHDAPARSVELGRLSRLILRLRSSLVRAADEVVVPQEARIQALLGQTGRRATIHCVWNCPRPTEARVEEHRERGAVEPLGVYYHGSINLHRVPVSLVEGCARSGVPIRLRIVGYETVGSRGSIAALREAAAKSGGSVILEVVGAKPRFALRDQMHSMHVGWINCRRTEEDSNLTHLFGASNKAFDYLAAAMPLLVPGDPVWQEAIVKSGFGIACDANNPAEIAAVLRWYYENPEKTAAMGRAGQEHIASDWNYDRQFLPLLNALAGS